jgi:L-fuculose-phosphate aldolase
MEEKELLVQYARLMYERKYTIASEGNISIRSSRNTLIITPSNLIKQFLTVDDLVEIDTGGNLVSGNRSPSSERFTHCAIYAQNPSTQAVIHAHPTFAILATVMDENPFSRPLLAETAMFLSDAVILPYAKPSTDEGAVRIREAATESKTILIRNHGSFTHGCDLATAFSLLEILEKCCMIHYMAVLSGRKISPLPAEEIEALLKISYGTA